MGIPVRSIAARVARHLRAPETLVTGGVATVMTVLMGPFGTFAGMSLAERGVYWTVVIWASIVLAFAVQVTLTTIMDHEGPAVRDVVVPIAFAVLFTPPLFWLTSFLRNADSGFSGIEMFFVVLVIAVSVTLMRRALGIEEPLELAPAVPRLLRRIEAPDGVGVVRLTVDDHYVEVHLTDGSHRRLLMRFADAVEELCWVDGCCIHRSHWVSFDAIARVLRDKGREMVELHDGTRLPVSRTCRANLEARGWFDASPAQAAEREQVGAR